LICAAVGGLAAWQQLRPRARLILDYRSRPRKGSVPILELANTGTIDAKNVRMHCSMIFEPTDAESSEDQRELDQLLYNCLQPWPLAENDPHWNRSASIIYLQDRHWLLTEPLSVQQRVSVEPRLEKAIRVKIRDDAKISGIAFRVETSTGETATFHDHDLVSWIREMKRKKQREGHAQ
jgi:hypothetical protein